MSPAPSDPVAADVVAITHLIHRYPELIDAGDFAGVAELFRYAHDMNHDEQGAPRDLEQLLRGLVRTYEGGRTSTHHVVTNVDVVVAPDRATATARSYITVLQARPELPLQVIASNRHEDTFERVDGTWRFSGRTDRPGLLGDMSHHVRFGYGTD
jgi:hypothetical protein